MTRVRTCRQAHHGLCVRNDAAIFNWAYPFSQRLSKSVLAGASKVFRIRAVFAKGTVEDYFYFISWKRDSGDIVVLTPMVLNETKLVMARRNQNVEADHICSFCMTPAVGKQLFRPDKQALVLTGVAQIYMHPCRISNTDAFLVLHMPAAPVPTDGEKPF